MLFMIFVKIVRNYSVIVFCNHEFFRPVSDDILVENNVTDFFDFY
jgi:hypothetical protein